MKREFHICPKCKKYAWMDMKMSFFSIKNEWFFDEVGICQECKRVANIPESFYLILKRVI